MPRIQDQPAPVPYAATGHPSIEQLMVEQGTRPITDPSVLQGSLWPEEESFEEFLETLHDSRRAGHILTVEGA